MLACSSAPRSSLASGWMPRELRLPSHPVWISSPASGLRPTPPPRGFVSDGKEGRLPVCTALVPEALCPVWWPGPRRVGRTCGRKLGRGTYSQNPLCWEHWDFLGEGALGCWRQGLAGERETHHQTRGSPPTFPPKCSQGGHSLPLAARTKMFLSVLNILYSFCF